MLFYRLLLSGQQIEPGLGHAHDLVLWKGFLKDGKGPDLPLEAPSSDEAAGPLEDESDDDMVLADRAPKAAARKRRKIETPPVGPGKGPVPKAPLPLPPPVVVPPVVGPVPPHVVIGPGHPGTPPASPVGPGEPESSTEPGDDMVIPVEEEEPPAPRTRAEHRPDKWVDGLGTKVRFDPDYVTPRGARFSANWQIRCVIAGHRRCF